jgi:hypothetical protein
VSTDSTPNSPRPRPPEPGRGRFTLKTGQATRWLAGQARSQLYASPRWEPTDSAQGADAADLIADAAQAGILTGPPEMDIRLDCIPDDDGGYYRVLVWPGITDLVLASPAQRWPRHGSGNAALAFLHDVTAQANQLLEALGAGGRQAGGASTDGTGTGWQPLRRGDQVVPAVVAAAAAADPQLAQALEASKAKQVWLNNRYIVMVSRRDDGSAEHLSIRRRDRQAARDWRDFQLIKNQLAGENAEAVELYPDEARLVDTANQYHLWCLPPGRRFPFGFEQRLVLDAGQTAAWVPGARQRPLDPAPAGAVNQR